MNPLSILQIPPIILLLDHVLNTGFILLILACLVATVFFDVLRHPKDSKQFIWRNWWHTPLLAYILYPVAMLVPPMVTEISEFYGPASVVGAAALILFLWAFITSGDPFYLPSDSPQKKRMLKISKKLITSGGFGSLCILSINILFWFPLLVWLAVLLASLVLYTTGFLLRYNTSRSPKPDEPAPTSQDPNTHEPRPRETPLKW